MSTQRTNTEKLYDIIRQPIITEKSVMASTLCKYVFEVAQDATKTEIRKAIELIYPGKKVKSVKTIPVLSHSKRLGYKFGRTDASKKAIVTVDAPIEELASV